MPIDVVTCFLRNRGAILLVRRSASASPFPGRWAGLSGDVAEDESPRAAAERTVRDRTGGSTVSFVRSGGELSVEDGDRAVRVHPYLVDCPTRNLEPGADDEDTEWVHAPAIRRRETVPGLWRAYERVAPTVRSVAADDDHGAATLSVRALECLRDRAGLLATGEDPGDWEELADLARRLRTARPSMAVLSNRINRVMATADPRPAAVERRAVEAIESAVAADDRAAERALDRVEGRRVLTLSRSGTVLTALREGDPATVFVAESRPAREGVGVAEELAAGTDVVVHTDAAIPQVVASEDVETVLVGADAVRPDGGVVNKTGTRVAALAADRTDAEFLVVAAADKVATGPVSLESGPGSAVYDGPEPITARNPTFDETPPDMVDGIVTERGTLDPGDVSALASELAALADWDADREQNEG